MRDSFVIYTSYRDQISMLTKEQQGYLLDAMITYASTGEIIDLDTVTGMAFSFIKSQMDRDFQKYDQVVERRREAGLKGGRPRKHKTEANEPEGIPDKKANGFSKKQKKQMVSEKSKQKQTKAKKPVYDYDYEDVYDSVNEDVYDSVNEDVYESENAYGDVKKKYSCAFEQTWQIYPRKKEKAAAYKAYKARLKDYTEPELDLAARRYAEECRILGTEERYIKHGATFFGPSLPFVDYLADDYRPPEPSRGMNRPRSGTEEMTKEEYLASWGLAPDGRTEL